MALKVSIPAVSVSRKPAALGLMMSLGSIGMRYCLCYLSKLLRPELSSCKVEALGLGCLVAKGLTEPCLPSNLGFLYAT